MRRKLNILLIDDDEMFVTQCKKRLEKESCGVYYVAPATNGEDGLRLAAEQNFDVAVVDMKMPDMDGMEVLRRIRELGLSVSPIMLTGFSDIQSAVEAMKRGAVDYMTKPLVISELIKKIESALTVREMERWQRERTADMPRPKSEIPNNELLQCLQTVTREGRHVAAVFLGELVNAESKTARRLRSVFKERRVPVNLITGVNMVTGKDVIRYLTSNDTVVIVSAVDVDDLPSTAYSLPRLSFSEILSEAARLGLNTRVSFVNLDPENPNLDVLFKEMT